MVGKYLNGYEFHPRVVPPGWTEWNAFADDAYYDYAINRNGVLRRYGRDPRSYSTDVITATAVSAIRRAGATRRPFFIWFTPYAPHTVGSGPDDESAGGRAIAAPADLGRRPDAPLPRTPAFNEADVGDKPPYVKATPRLSPVGVRDLAGQYRSALASLAAVDRAVGSIVAALRETGQLERTLVVYTSDNGYLYGEHRQVGKVRPYESSIRVPLLIRGPGLPAGVHRTDLVVNADLAPTIARAAGVRPGREPDGMPLFPAPAKSRDRVLLLERLRGKKQLRFTGIRTARWLYAEYESGPRELYDLRADPYQLNNLAADPAHREVREGLSRELSELRDCRGRACLRFLPG
jgi:arylsulfatase A-like enzyme